MKRVTIASLNTLGFPFLLDNLSLRYKAIARYFNTSDVDVIHFQEIFFWPNLLIMKRHLTSFPYYIYKNSLQGPKGGLVTFSRKPIYFRKYITYPQYFSKVDLSLFDVLAEKGILITSRDTKDILLANTHLNAVFDGNWTERGKYYKTLKAQIDTFNHTVRKLGKKHIVIASGDFNTERSSNLSKEMINDTSLQDVFANNVKATHIPVYAFDGKGQRIDYLFYSGEKQNIVSSEYLFTKKVKLSNKRRNFVSDHIGLVATFKF